MLGVVGVLVLLTAVQLRYPANALLPFARIDDIGVGGWDKAAATSMLDKRYNEADIALYFGDSDAPYATVLPADIGVSVANGQRVEVLSYPWYLRLAPGSLFWGHMLADEQAPAYSRDDAKQREFIEKMVGSECRIDAKSASAAIEDKKIVVKAGSVGGTCIKDDVSKAIATIAVTGGNDVVVRLPIDAIEPAVSDDEARLVTSELTSAIDEGVDVTVAGEPARIPYEQLVEWIDFDNSGDTLTYSFNAERAAQYMNESFGAKVAVPAGTTTIATYDFVEVSRVNGASGQTLDVGATLTAMQQSIATGGATPAVQVAAVAPKLIYTRTYSPTHVGLSALMQNFAQTNAGTYGVALTELSGQYRRATYNVSTTFTTASTYKLFVAYSTLLRIESGAWKWTDQVTGGRDLAKCFDDMIVVSDSACATTLLARIGYTTITNEARAIGCTSTSFLGNDGIKTTAGDLALLLAQLQTGQILQQQSSRDILINAMKRNIYRQGIPKGVAGTVADKVGFLDGLLHDAGIVYANTGTYVLVIMTNGSSWANIAELTRQIEALRIQ